MPRISITITDDMKKYYEELSKQTGVSQSALIALDLTKLFKNKKKE